MRKACIDAGVMTSKNWGRTFNALVDRGFLEIQEPFVSVSDKGQQAVTGA
ncbi:hypothetical protein [Endozoicomonas euniceicola]|uniref:Transposase n=1 Tax=Endozoicomonas euniceicola TaxID=1234143 RepID=A0ABY6GU04_9GAMM|nr:hypothetical protein [Endozoicomonas euniceicola]UYM16270.1 hypothetical protein NX720_26325 [Endozoicomonas euniceicola]